VTDETPVLIFDGRCGMCTRSVLWLLRRTRRDFRALPYQSVDLVPFGVSEEEAAKAAWWVERGRRWRGHAAIGKALAACRFPWPFVGFVLRVPPISWLAALGYLFVAHNRRLFPGTTPACKREWDLEGGRPADG